MAHFWPPEYLNPILEDLTGFEECRGFRGFSINTMTKQIINTRTHRLNRSKFPWSDCVISEGDYYVNVPKHRIAGITHHAQILYSDIEKKHNELS